MLLLLQYVFGRTWKEAFQTSIPFLVMLMIALTVYAVESQDIEAEQVTACVDLRIDEYPEWQMLGGYDDAWVGYDNGGFVPEILVSRPHKVYLDTQAGWQMIWYYLPEGSKAAYVLSFNIDSMDMDNWTAMTDGAWGIHPCGAYRVNRDDLVNLTTKNR